MLEFLAQADPENMIPEEDAVSKNDSIESTGRGSQAVQQTIIDDSRNLKYQAVSGMGMILAARARPSQLDAS